MPPPRGFQDVMVNITATWLGPYAILPGPGEGFYGENSLDTALELVGANNNTYYLKTGGGLLDSCGTYPNSLDTIPQMLPAETATANACWQVLSTDVPTLELYYSNSYTSAQGWFALR
jgi:hypothetical protein